MSNPGDAWTTGAWYLWCDRCGRVGQRRMITPAKLSELYDQHQKVCPRRNQPASTSPEQVKKTSLPDTRSSESP